MTPGALRVFLLVTALFFLWGIPNNLNDILIRQFMKSFAISRFQAGLVQSAFYLGYFLFALPAGFLMRSKGYKAGLLTGLLLFAGGCALFLPAANVGKYSWFLTALFVVASGLAFLETASNPLIAELGDTGSAARRLNLSQAFNPLGSIVGVLIGTRFIFSGVELTPAQVDRLRKAGSYAGYLHSETLRIVSPYLVLGSVAIVWACMIARTPMPRTLHAHEEADSNSKFHWRLFFKNRMFVLSLVAQFLYVGAQVGTWTYFIQYAQDYVHTTERIAGLLLTGTLAAFAVGRFVSAKLMKRIRAARLMQQYAAINVVLILIGILLPGWKGLGAILLTSFCMSIMFPTIFTLGLQALNSDKNVGGSLLVMTIIGGAILTPLMGIIAERSHSSSTSYCVPLASYLFITLYSSMVLLRSPRAAQISCKGKPVNAQTMVGQ